MPFDVLESIGAAIRAECPGGADLSLSPELDEIRAARTGEDDALSQGEWVCEVRPPQWARVRELCEAVLTGKSKDLQVACWYAEALTMLEGFEGLARGILAVERILDRFWNTCHPLLDGTSSEARAGRVEWLEAALTAAVKQVPLTAPGTGAYSWFRLEEARAVDNLGLRDPKARDQALAEGKIPGEAFHKAVLLSGPRFLESLQGSAKGALDACGALQAVLERRFGAGGPGMEDLARTVRACADFLGQARARHFPPGEPAPAPARGPERAARPALREREDAVAGLRTAAAWFRDHEPHSPVAPLAERAAAWAEMPLEGWLSEVIKDPATLASLRELLNLDRHPTTN